MSPGSPPLLNKKWVGMYRREGWFTDCLLVLFYLVAEFCVTLKVNFTHRYHLLFCVRLNICLIWFTLCFASVFYDRQLMYDPEAFCFSLITVRGCNEICKESIYFVFSTEQQGASFNGGISFHPGTSTYHHLITDCNDWIHGEDKNSFTVLL